ncbi:ORF MSV117 putative DNA polymerase beta/AP endonuclease, similar to Rattus norvegicus GB:M13962 and Caenorhabditis elegans GB:Z47812 [Melanoplus sanguinipes entomopoxvirus]|uniref:Probable AP endonuclease n=1 Tax=Melanoplus sanguinipes entomopoxvirus TaxID=83191 RepID=Q9YVX5_MSEPV|nr:ORF MSV117 putative DNA polymerase beta/AP endonuclease, similar to Rattus norvegicus GB:M13962 and Caenorhabditis elegans GB:Z47812 [Melanoplus sanguinipes entomopoxvirus]AAC97660.1 ORF MSV117 putative DNA polymerase beta/AP endonuclease, similar to Rattus norvegicus GB:M13962 and Caenorhabditis elegans GB:Z47812 [Melanoplus sanguinipes entomopoxvirus 'O']
MLIGFHTTKDFIKEYANEYVLQFFLGSPFSYLSSTTPIPFKANKHNKIFIHSKYVGNIANSKSHVTISNLKKEIVYLDTLNVNKCGSIFHLTKIVDSKEKSINTIVSSLEKLSSKLDSLNLNTFNYVIIETSNIVDHIGSTIEDLALIYNKLSSHTKNRVRFCIDTAHIFNTYYAINTVKGIVDYLIKFDVLIGLNKVVAIHLNDSEGMPLSSIRPHISITEGKIFYDYKSKLSPLHIIKLFSLYYNIPCILERKTITDDLSEINKEIKIFNNLNISNIDLNTFMAILNKRKIIYMLHNIANIYEKLDENKYKAYNKAINSIYEQGIIILKYNNTTINSPKLVDNMETVISKYKDIPNIGDSISKKIYNIISNTYIDNISNTKEYKYITELMNVLYIGPKTAKNLISKGIKTIKDLKKNKDKYLNSQQQIAIEYYDKLKPINRSFISNLESSIKLSPNKEWYILGSYARGKLTSKDIDILIVDFDIDEILKEIYKYAKEEAVLRHGKIMYSGIFKKDKTYFLIDIYKTTESEKYTSIQYFTGSKEFNIALRSLALSKDIRLNQHEMYDLQTQKKYNIKSEKDIFDILGVKYVPPSKRDIYTTV